jgi:hypothetical protein
MIATIARRARPAVHEQLHDQFRDQGHCVLPSLLPESMCEALVADVDRKLEQGGEAIDYPALGPLTSYPPLLEVVESLLGPGFALHHFNATRYEAGDPGRAWHHDYRQYPQTNRTHVMLHALCYPRGLNGEIGDLILLPGSHRSVADRRAMLLFGTAELPGSLTISILPPGTVVLIHSAIFHGRRPKPGGEGRPRYFLDVSYCARGVLWPGHEYGRGWRENNRRALELGLDHGGLRAHLYDSSLFFSVREAKALLGDPAGSVGLEHYRLRRAAAGDQGDPEG